MGHVIDPDIYFSMDPNAIESGFTCYNKVIFCHADVYSKRITFSLVRRFWLTCLKGAYRKWPFVSVLKMRTHTRRGHKTIQFLIFYTQYFTGSRNNQPASTSAGSKWHTRTDFTQRCRKSRSLLFWTRATHFLSKPAYDWCYSLHTYIAQTEAFDVARKPPTTAEKPLFYW